MTTLLQKAFQKASALPDDEQDLLAERLLAELESEDAFDRAIEQTAHKLKTLAEAAIVEDDAGVTEDLDPDRL